MATTTTISELTLQRRQRLRRKQAGLCIACGVNPTTGYAKCFECRWDNAQYMTEQRNKPKRRRRVGEKADIKPYVMRLLFYAGWTVNRGRWVDPQTQEEMWWKRAYYRELCRG